METKYAINITYGMLTFNTVALFEYKHTGKQYYFKNKAGNHYLSGEESAKEKKQSGKKIIETSGYYFIDRIAIPSNNGWWYVNNPGDQYNINRVSKYANKRHAELSQKTEKNY